MSEKLALKDRGFISLMNAGWKATEAFRCIFPSMASPSSIPTLSSRKTAMLAEYINYKSMNNNGNVEVSFPESITEESLEVLDKNAIIQRMRKIAETSTDLKVKLDAYQKIAMIEGMKKDQSGNAGQEQQIRYYLPLRCENCDFKTIRD